MTCPHNTRCFTPTGGNDYPGLKAFVHGLSAGETCCLPPATIHLTIPDNQPIVPPAGVSVSGAGRQATVLRCTPGSGSGQQLLQLRNPAVSLRGFHVRYLSAGEENGQLVSIGADHLLLQDLEIEAGHTTTHVNVIHAILQTGDLSHLVLRDLHIHKVRRAYLRTIHNTSRVENVLVDGCLFERTHTAAVVFNSPRGLTSDVVVRNCTFRDVEMPVEFAEDPGEFPGIHLGGASVKGFRIEGNYFEGEGKGSVHVEEAAEDWTITGNVFRGEGDGVQILGNNVAGEAKAPQRIVVEGNTFCSGGTRRIRQERKRRGVYVHPGNGGALPDQILIVGNVIRGYEYGVRAERVDTVLVTNNWVEDCDIGIFKSCPSTDVRDNRIGDCTRALGSEIGGLWGRQSDRLLGGSGSGTVSLRGWERQFDNVHLEPGVTTFPLAPLGFGAEGTLYVHYYHSENEYKSAKITMSWDGSILSASRDFHKGSGKVVLRTGGGGPLLGIGNTLYLHFNNQNPDARRGGRVSAVFDGIYVLDARLPA